MFLILFHLIIKIVYLLTYLIQGTYTQVIHMCHLYWLNYATEYVVSIVYWLVAYLSCTPVLCIPPTDRHD